MGTLTQSYPFCSVFHGTVDKTIQKIKAFPNALSLAGRTSQEERTFKGRGICQLRVMKPDQSRSKQGQRLRGTLSRLSCSQPTGAAQTRPRPQPQPQATAAPSHGSPHLFTVGILREHVHAGRNNGHALVMQKKETGGKHAEYLRSFLCLRGWRNTYWMGVA